MGKGNDPNCRGTPMTVAAPAGPFDPGGPDATPDELLAWAREHHLETISDDLLRMLDDPTDMSYSNYPSRRAMEAMIAMREGMDLTEFQQRNAHLSWSELLDEYGDRTYRAVPLHRFAGDVELRLRHRINQDPDPLAVTRIDPRTPLPAAPPEHLAARVQKLGPGARSGRLHDYTRAELRKLLGLLERDCKDLTDDDLRGMALTAGLVPAYPDRPSHAQLACAHASRSSGERYQRQQFLSAMRMSYDQLSRHMRYDQHKLATTERLELAAKRNPIIAVGLSHDPELIDKTYVPTERPGRIQPADGAKTEPKSRLELRFDPAFRGFTGQFPGDHRLRSIKPGLGGRRGCLGLYEPETGDIYIHQSLVKIIDRAQRNDAGPDQIEHAVSTVAHELFHAMEGRDSGNDQTGRVNHSTPQHTLDEGATEALARLHTQDLAQRMGVWNPDQGSLREHATSGSYPKEVETVIALIAYAHGELDRDQLKLGKYAQPEALSDAARHAMLELHTEHGVNGRIDTLARMISQRREIPIDTAERQVTKVLAECKKSRYTWRRRRIKDEHFPSRWRVEHVPPESLPHRLDELLP